jgi:molybdopterin/thiamine biosynthesis adenylyltransferase
MGRPKIEVVAEMARDINPESDIRLFRDGVTDANLDEFLKDVDVYVDSLDFFVLEVRRKVFRRCRELGIPAMTAAPLGMGTAFLYFSPTGMSFEDYFQVEGAAHEEQYARFIAGVSPAMLSRQYLVDPEAVNFKERRGPSTGMACELCAGVMGTNVLKLLLNRGPLRAAPSGMHFDAYRGTLKHTWRPGGNSHPLQRLLIALIKPVLRGR